ncbi:oligosaccharide flippase family protein [Macrococcoides canis]|uniref:lipopolysaccharide biosynthesis protein n=1 Tax=Macrococcoides canis TaxID=1855823 RepID=UPI0020B8B531|nr:oligosaccharide flippase family protein [Macrococcus canis]UTH00862.1 oligosaccharide flippase family protein [Macrococcus canis]UTH03226.1 oligosaccharide flippase family protein [Macrococcus canis]
MNKLISASLIYTSTNVINRLLPFLLLPFLTSALNKNEYGIISMTEVFINIMLPIISLNSFGAISRKYYDKISDFGSYLYTSIILNILMFLIFSLIFYLFSNLFTKLLGFELKWIVVCLLIVFLKSIFQTHLTMLQITNQPMTYGILQILNTLVNFSLTIYLILNLNFRWDGRLVSQIIGFGIFAIISLYLLNRKYKLINYQKEYAKDIVSFGVPLIPHSLGGMLITMSDRIIITNMVGLAATGVYAVGTQIGMVIWMIQDAFNKAWIPFLFNKLKNPTSDNKLLIVKITYIYIIVISILTLALYLSSSIIVDIFIDDKYKEATKYIGLIGLGYAFNGIYKMVSGPLFYFRKTYILSYVTALTAILNIVLCIIFIKLFGTIGAAISTCLSFFIGMVVVWYFSNKEYKLPWDLKGE